MKLKDLQKIEFWAATAIYVIALISIFSNANHSRGNRDYWDFREIGLTYSYFSNYLVPYLFKASLIYFSFLLLNFCVAPALIKRVNELMNYSLIAILIGFVGLITGICNTYSQGYLLSRYDTLQSAYNRIFFDGFMYAIWLVMIICGYVLVKEFFVFLFDNRDKKYEKQDQLKVDVGVGLAFWLITMLLLIASHADFEGIVVWSLLALASLANIVYGIHYQLPLLLPQQFRYKIYLKSVFYLSLLLAIPMSLIAMVFFFGKTEGVLVTFFIHLPLQLLLCAPIAWFIFKKRMKNSKEIYALKTQLGKTDATLSFLQSQINPHFLFNALNTLYGTALQENAERTGEGIQKLGDMMRFMLHENVQDKISLTRDIDYLQNYIALQKLRTSRSAVISIETQIDEYLGNLEIAPMLLIPFVENAFKHGISLQNPSHIKITLQTRGNTLYFDVHNSIHIKPDSDPEKLKSGIGLENVKNRLKLLYNGKHDLMIRESAKEFFIHLTLELA